jgi:parallel beta-helix repeat protein
MTKDYNLIYFANEENNQKNHVGKYLEKKYKILISSSLTLIIILVAVLVPILTINKTKINNSVIYINGNDQLEKFCIDSGKNGSSISSAYTIEYREIELSTFKIGIHLRNINKYVVIRYCLIQSSLNNTDTTGIILYNCKNIIIHGCVLDNNTNGLYAKKCKNLNIRLSSFSFCDQNGIKMKRSNKCVITQNQFFNNSEYGLTVYASNSNLITNNEMKSNRFNCYTIHGRNNMISDNGICNSIIKESTIFSEIWFYYILIFAGLPLIGIIVFIITYIIKRRRK